MAEWNYNLDEIPKKKGFEILATREDGQVTIIVNFNSNERLTIPIIAWMPIPEPAGKKKHKCFRKNFPYGNLKCEENREGEFEMHISPAEEVITVDFCPFCGEESPSHAKEKTSF